MKNPLKIVRRWIWNVLYATDVWMNAVGGGDPQHTISLRAARAAARGDRKGKIVCWILDKFEPNHCKNCLDSSENGGRA